MAITTINGLHLSPASTVLAIFSYLFQLTTVASLELQLQGSDTSFAKFPKWSPCQNGSIGFSFKTAQSYGLLLYADDARGGDFIELKLVSGMVRLRMNTGGGTLIMTAGSHLHDNGWHSIEVRLQREKTVFVSDRIEQSKTHRGDDYTFGNDMDNSYVFIGGLPVGYNAGLAQLALPSVMLEPRFRGNIRNLRYSKCGEPSQTVDYVDYKGIKTNGIDACATNNSCQNEAQCVATDTGIFCDCSNTRFFGRFCEKEWEATEATFYGQDYLSYSLVTANDPIVSSRDHIFLRFRTRQPNGLLFYTGSGTDHIKIWLDNGGIFVSVNLGAGQYETALPSVDGLRFDDNTWHSVSVIREAREIKLEVDHRHRVPGTVFGDFQLLTSDTLYVAGVGMATQLQGPSHYGNFRGCMAEVWYVADHIRLDLLVLALHQHGFIGIHGNPTFDQCDNFAYSQPVTLATEDSFIAVPNTTLNEHGTIAFSFRTTEPNGVLMYSLGQAGQSDFLGFELFEGSLNFVIDIGTGPIKVKINGDISANDGLMHTVKNIHLGKTGSVYFDDEEFTYRIGGRKDKLDLQPTLYIGSIASPNHTRLIPPHLFSAALGYGFVGCIQDLEINDKYVDIAYLARLSGSPDVRSDECQADTGHCSSEPCLHGGKCSEGWGRYVCDCSQTGYTGETCAKVAMTLAFDGTQYVAIRLAHEVSNEVEDISLRFRTLRSNGLLFMTTSNSTNDRLIVALEVGEIRLDVAIGSHFQSVRVGSGLNDDKWHTFSLKRRQKRLLLKVDEGEEVKAKLKSTTSPSLNISSLHLASKDQVTFPITRPGEPGETHGPENFVGQMQHFRFNRKDMFEPIKMGDLRRIDTNADLIQNEDDPVKYPMTFHTQEAYLFIKYKFKRTFAIYLHLRTTQGNGLILYSGKGNSNDFMAVELYNGQVRYIFDVGDGPQLIESNLDQPINDNEWHTVAVIRPRLRRHTLRVDDTSKSFDMGDSGAVNLDTDPNFYIGGVSRQIYTYLPNKVKSRTGYQGCLASIDLDGDTRNVLDYRHDIEKEHRELITEGCQGPEEECSPSSCANQGKCVQGWETFTCDCSMTSYTGTNCAKVSTTYTFGGNGLIAFTLPPGERLDTDRDSLALGFMTTQSDAVLVRINSGDSDDYLEMELVAGNVFVVYNMGTADHAIYSPFSRLDDGDYHVIRFTRSGPNATLQIDDQDVETRRPHGHQMKTFNQQAEVFVGGRKDKAGRIMRPFQGIISGLMLNNQPLLDFAATGDPRISIEGDVTLDQDPPVPTYRVTTEPIPVTLALSSPSPHRSTLTPVSTDGSQNDPDDLIVSGMGSGCGFESSIDCPPEVEATSRLVVPKTRPPPTTSTIPSVSDELSSGDGFPCFGDDEDCDVTSGQGQIDDLEKESQSPLPPGDGDAEEITFGGNEGAGYSVKPSNNTGHDIVVSSAATTTKTTMFNKVTDSSPSRSKGDTNTVDTNQNESILQTTPAPGNTRTSSMRVNIVLILSIALGLVLLLLIFSYAFYKYRSRDEGTYKIDETKNYRYETVSTKAPIAMANGGANGCSAKGHGSKANRKKGTVKEWYV